MKPRTLKEPDGYWRTGEVRANLAMCRAHAWAKANRPVVRWIVLEGALRRWAAAERAIRQ